MDYGVFSELECIRFPPGLQLLAAIAGDGHEREMNRVRQEIIVTKRKWSSSAGSMERMPGLVQNDPVSLSIGQLVTALD